MAFDITFVSPQTMQVSLQSGSGMNTDFGNVIERHTDDYNDLLNKPSINTVDVIGDKTGSDYHLQDKLTAGDYISIDGTTISAELEYATYNEVINYLNS